MEALVLLGFALGGLFFIPAFAISVGASLKWVWDLWTTKKESYNVEEEK